MCDNTFIFLSSMGGGSVQDTIITIYEFNNVDLKNRAWREWWCIGWGFTFDA